jgi:hypothetical protein
MLLLSAAALISVPFTARYDCSCAEVYEGFCPCPEMVCEIVHNHNQDICRRKKKKDQRATRQARGCASHAIVVDNIIVKNEEGSDEVIAKGSRE